MSEIVLVGTVYRYASEDYLLFYLHNLEWKLPNGEVSDSDMFLSAKRHFEDQIGEPIPGLRNINLYYLDDVCVYILRVDEEVLPAPTQYTRLISVKSLFSLGSIAIGVDWEHYSTLKKILKPIN